MQQHDLMQPHDSNATIFKYHIFI